jgi:hypothetical protein
MTLNLHFLHIINTLEIKPWLINHQLKGQKPGLQSCNFVNYLVHSATNIQCNQQFLGYGSIKTSMNKIHLSNMAMNRIQTVIDIWKLKTIKKHNKFWLLTSWREF